MPLMLWTPRKALRRLVKEVLGKLLVAVEECMVMVTLGPLVDSAVNVAWTLVPSPLGNLVLTTYRWTRVLAPVKVPMLLMLRVLSVVRTRLPRLSSLRKL